MTVVMKRSKRYQLLFRGVAGDRDSFKAKMVQKGVREFLVEQMLIRAPVIIKQNLSMELARKYADSLARMGARVTILDQASPGKDVAAGSVPTPMSGFAPCPHCGLIQSQNDVCPRCGLNLVAAAKGGEDSVTSDRT